MKTLSKTLTIGLIISLFPFYGMSQNSATHVIIIFEEDIGVEPINRRIDTIVEVINIADCDEGVVINGIRWATRNVDAPGTFAPYPESSGMLFQWNRKKGWNATDEEVEGWDTSMQETNNWARSNDPCPRGWRVPTRAELTSLSNADSEWITQNDANGRLLGTVPNQIFLPATGWRHGTTGKLEGVGANGYYWSSTQNISVLACYFDIKGMRMSSNWNTVGTSIRCVAE